jgi:hypothetical protein
MSNNKIKIFSTVWALKSEFSKKFYILFANDMLKKSTDFEF